MSVLADLFDPAHVALDVAATSKKRVLELLAQRFADADALDANAVFRALLAREQLGSTGIGEGIAIPHARIKGLTRPRAAFLRLAEGVDFDAVDHLPVRLVVGLLVPEEATEAHLELLAALAEMLSDPERRHELLAVADPGRIAGFFA